METVYNKTKIERALKHFTRATGINVQFLKSDFSSLDIDYPQNSYCESIHSTSKGRQGCLNSDKALLLRCKESRRPETQVCHAGLVDVAVPIIYRDEIIGYLILGQMKTDKPFEQIKNYLSELSLDALLMESCYKERPMFEPERIESVVSVAEMLSKFLLLEDTLLPRFEFGIHSAVEFINSNIDKTLSVELLSRKSGVSKNTLYRGFKKEFGITVGEYIARKRLEKARELLLSTNLSVE